jgi:hypothetical protein
MMYGTRVTLGWPRPSRFPFYALARDRQVMTSVDFLGTAVECYRNRRLKKVICSSPTGAERRDGALQELEGAA